MNEDDTIECDPALPIGPPRKVTPPTVQVCVTLSARHYDWFCALATRNHISVPEAIRRVLKAERFSH